MKASVLIGPKTSEVRDVPVPEIGTNDVLLKVKACGVCRSELEQWLGQEDGQQWQSKEEEGSPYPIILGHEPSGVIEDVMLDMNLNPRPVIFLSGDNTTLAVAMASGIKG